MKKLFLPFTAVFLFSFSSPLFAEIIPPRASQSETSMSSIDIEVMSYDERVPAGRILDSLPQGTGMLKVLKLFSGPNIISRDNVSGDEIWKYDGLWGLKIKNPLRDSIILMDSPGKRVKKPSQVTLTIRFDDEDRVKEAWFEFPQDRRAKK
ncbi:MAG: hypothetical protein KDK66_01050 [Deltaproteobacteria bacterium]|nr:hypothetical protein [Deltaproteobacteria bacterium]